MCSVLREIRNLLAKFSTNANCDLSPSCRTEPGGVATDGTGGPSHQKDRARKICFIFFHRRVILPVGFYTQFHVVYQAGTHSIVQKGLSILMLRRKSMPNLFVSIATFLAVICGGCGTEASNTAEANLASPASANKEAATAVPPASIEIRAGSPADTVRAFYTKLREKRFREAIFLTNLRPAVEGLTDAELKEFQVDFERIAAVIPAEVTINGEIVSGDRATVTASLPGDDPEKLEAQSIDLRKDGDVWVILTVDEAAEARIRKEGRNYFYALKIETHEDEARNMLDRIARAQMAFSATNGGSFGSIDQLVGAGFLPEDVKTSDSTGYTYQISVNPDKTVWSATATPAVYGKSGRLSFYLSSDGKSTPRITSKDNGGKPLEKVN